MAFALGLDIGTKKTGVAFGETDRKFVVALDTIYHTSEAELRKKLLQIISDKKIELIVIGLPRLPGGAMGKQAQLVQALSKKIESDSNVRIQFVDERFTSQGQAMGENDDTYAACSILNMALDSH